ncbi:MAG TPA: DUF1801 domain-containing protein [Chlorobiota bacterium]|nr:DUF1801 domain-containing protein [Chlorobiota bacterium]
MKNITTTVEDFLADLEPRRREAFVQLWKTIEEHLPDGFSFGIGYGMMGWAVPHSVYPKGYHVDPKQPLPFVGLASQKNFIALYHMGLYMMPEHISWFQAEYAKRVPNKLDMGKSCIRFKKLDAIPFDLIGELMERISVLDYVEAYERNLPTKQRS